MIDVKPKKKMAVAIKIVPHPPTAEESARWVSSIPLMEPDVCSNAPDDRMTG